ncbi:hypothetical protein [Frigoribacterium sp. UYMn621]|uniref:hypothetical protein n=1 Tax=Frigoribacterium sp. UYMn621 TaxID=3156343 RepID=UPI003399EABF
MNTRSAAFVVTAASAVLLVSSCSAIGSVSGSSPDAASAPSVAPSVPEQTRATRADTVENIDVCALLPLETVVGVTGRAFTRASSGTAVKDGIPLAACAYEGADQDLASMLVMSVFVYPAGGAAAVDSYRKNFGGGSSRTPLPGVGDSAESSGHDLVARFGQHVIAVVDGSHGGYADDFTVDKRAVLVQAVHDAL